MKPFTACPTPAEWRAIEALGVRRLVADSRAVRPGDTFVAYPGSTHDGRDYIAQAIERGAASVLWERSGFTWDRGWPLPNAAVRGLRARAGEIAARVYGRPSRRLWVVGVTGTNGKTTCSQWIARALSAAGRRCAVVGTLGHGLRPPLAPLAHTTPDALWLQERLAAFVRAGARAVSLEVSSIGLDQHRVAGVEFDVALFTNLTRDHLDYHRTLERYREAKARLFACESLRYAVINLDDAFGRELARRVRRRGLELLGYGFGPAEGGRAARVAASELEAGARGLSFRVSTPWGAARVRARALGRFNAANLLGTLAVLLASGVALGRAVAALAELGPVPGRMQRLGGGARPLVVVDYAHTPDALEQALRALRELLSRLGEARARRARSARDGGGRARHPQLICVFGCGGERDRGKRPLMGAIAARLADRVIVTSDNPRGEEPQAIIADIVRGMRGAARVWAVEPDRAAAIRQALGAARRGDIVLVAGKGHESYQEVRGVRHPFSDVAIAREALREWA